MHFCVFRSTSHGFFTDVHWRCEPYTNVRSFDWYLDQYDDSSWSNARAISEHSTYSTEFLRTNFGLYAKLLWYFDDSYKQIYCRGRLSYGKPE